jgi:hypothetical protein
VPKKMKPLAFAAADHAGCAALDATKANRAVNESVFHNMEIAPPAALDEIDFNLLDPTVAGMVPETPDVIVCHTLEEFRPLDVYCQQGCIWNTEYRAAIQDFKPLFALVDPQCRKALARSVVILIRSRGGRFLAKTKYGLEGFYEIGDTRAQAKVYKSFQRHPPSRDDTIGTNVLRSVVTRKSCVVSNSSIGVTPTESLLNRRQRSKLPKAAREVDFDVFNPPQSPHIPEAEVLPIYNITENDVVSLKTVKDTKFLTLVLDFVPFFPAASDPARSALARSVVLIVRKRGGRFLLQKEGNDFFLEMGDTKAQDKAFRTLRRYKERQMKHGCSDAANPDFENVGHISCYRTLDTASPADDPAGHRILGEERHAFETSIKPREDVCVYFASRVKCAIRRNEALRHARISLNDEIKSLQKSRDDTLFLVEKIMVPDEVSDDDSSRGQGVFGDVDTADPVQIMLTTKIADFEAMMRILDHIAVQNERLQSDNNQLAQRIAEFKQMQKEVREDLLHAARKARRKL